MPFVRHVAPAAALTLTLTLSFGALAQPAPRAASDWPAKPIRFVVPFTPGGTADILARALAQKMSDGLGQPVAVDNRGGSGGVIGTEIAARSPPDGHTLMMGITANIAINPSLYRKLPYSPDRDFAAVTLIASAPYLLVVPPALPARTVKDLLSLARARPGELAYASFGNGSANHLAGELFATLSGTRLLHVPYKNIGQGVADLIAGQVQLLFLGIVSAKPHVDGGKLRALASTGRQRSPMTPNLPTVHESGVPEYEVTGWYGLFVPAGTPPDIVTRLHAEAVKAIRQPDVQERLTQQGAELVGNTPQQFAAYVKAETAKWAKVVKASGAVAD